MSAVELEQVRRIDAPAVVRAMAACARPSVEPVELLGGSAGACLVQWADGHQGVLTWFPPVPPSQPSGSRDRATKLMGMASAAGVPLPRYEAVVPTGDPGVAVLQERIQGRAPEVVMARLIEHVLELAHVRRGLLVETDKADSPMALFLTSSGAGFCLHEPLRDLDRRTRKLLAVIETTVSPENDHLRGGDIVHFDYHPGNAIVHRDRPDAVAAIIDWGGT